MEGALGAVSQLLCGVISHIDVLTIKSGRAGMAMHLQVVDSRKFGLPQRRRRLYILGAPRTGKAPIMKSSVGKMATLRSFLSTRGKKEKYPSDLQAINHADVRTPATLSQPQDFVTIILSVMLLRKWDCIAQLESGLQDFETCWHQPQDERFGH